MKKVNRIRLWLALAALMAFVGCTQYQSHFPVPDVLPRNAENFNKMTGYWYGEVILADGSIQKWLSEKNEDGTFSTHFKMYMDGKFDYEQTESGKWGVNDTTEIEIVDLIKNRYEEYVPNTREGVYVERYKIVKLDSATFWYVNEYDGTQYETIRVQADYKF